MAHIRQSRPDSGLEENVAHKRQSRPDSGLEANIANVRQSRPDSGHGFQVQVLKTVEVVPSSLGSGRVGTRDSGLGLEV